MEMGEQESYYLAREADDYFERRSVSDKDPPNFIRSRIGRIMQMLTRNRVKPEKVLEVGGAGGLLLAELQKEYECECLGIEPSEKAVEFAQRTHGNIEMRRGVASNLPRDKTRYYDLVVAKGVFCWIGREELLRSIAEIDRVLADGGYLLIADYLPEYPRRNRNVHVKDADIHCFKIDHSKIFLDTHIYTLIGSETYFDEGERFQGRFDDTRNYCSLLKKSYKDYYLPASE